jgi:hypothetical protein
MATINHTVTVSAYLEGNRFKIDGAKTPNLYLVRGNTYIFDTSSTTLTGHLFGFATSADGANNTGYTDGVNVTGTAGTPNANVTIIVPMNAPETLYYYSSAAGDSQFGASSAIHVSGVNIADIADKDAVADIVVNDFVTNVSIFTNTLAKDIPSKINAISEDFKAHINDEFADVVVGDVNSFIDNLETYLNDTVVAAINSAVETIRTDAAKFAGDVAKEQVTYAGAFDEKFEGLEAGLGNYINNDSSLAYSKGDIDNQLFTNAVSAAYVSYDNSGRLTSYRVGGKYIWNISYDASGFIDGFNETVTIGGVSNQKSYVVNTNVDGEITSITVVV